MPVLVCVLVCTFFLAAGATAQPFGSHDIAVMKYVGLERDITDEDVERIVDRMNEILRDDDGAGSADIECAVRFEKVGGIVPFEFPSGAQTPGTIQTEDELNTILGLEGGNVKVVDRINFCKIIRRVTGCAPIPGSSFVVVSETHMDSGLAWIHEFGHNTGLNHRPVDGMVMRGDPVLMGPHVTVEDCEEFRAGRVGRLR